MKTTPYELIPPGKPSFSTKDRFTEMRSFAAEIWREENGIEDGAAIELILRKPKSVKSRVISDLYRKI